MERLVRIGRQVHDAQPSVPQRYIIVRPHRQVVWPSMRDRARRGFDLRAANWRAVEVHDAANTTHLAKSFRRMERKRLNELHDLEK